MSYLSARENPYCAYNTTVNIWLFIKNMHMKC